MYWRIGMSIKDKLKECLNKIKNMPKDDVIKAFKEKGLYEELFIEHDMNNDSRFIIKTKLNG